MRLRIRFAIASRARALDGAERLRESLSAVRLEAIGGDQVTAADGGAPHRAETSELPRGGITRAARRLLRGMNGPDSFPSNWNRDTVEIARPGSDREGR